MRIAAVQLRVEAQKSLDEYLIPYREAQEFIRNTLDVGVEYASGDGTLFGVMLKEMSSDSPYRVQWYDERGLSGHSEVSSPDAAAKILLSDLGMELQLAPGSMDKLFEAWDYPIKQALKLLAHVN